VVGHFFSFSKTLYSFLYSFCFAYKEKRAKAPWFYRSDGLVTVENVVGGRTKEQAAPPYQIEMQHCRVSRFVDTKSSQRQSRQKCESQNNNMLLHSKKCINTHFKFIFLSLQFYSSHCRSESVNFKM
jgi:hypothetical protein